MVLSALEIRAGHSFISQIKTRGRSCHDSTQLHTADLTLFKIPMIFTVSLAVHRKKLDGLTVVDNVSNNFFEFQRTETENQINKKKFFVIVITLLLLPLYILIEVLRGQGIIY